MRGGYQMLDFRGISISSTAVTIDGVYETIEGNYYKPLLLCGINIGGVDKNDIFVELSTSNSNYTFDVYGGIITITKENKVTFVAKERVKNGSNPII